MGQYFYVVNLDKKEYLHPHDLDDGLKMGEFVPTLETLGYLVSDSASYITSDLVGTWAGDRIQITGDYSKTPFEHDGQTYENLYFAAAECFNRISKRADVKEFHDRIQKQYA